MKWVNIFPGVAPAITDMTPLTICRTVQASTETYADRALVQLGVNDCQLLLIN